MVVTFSSWLEQDCDGRLMVASGEEELLWVLDVFNDDTGGWQPAVRRSLVVSFVMWLRDVTVVPTLRGVPNDSDPKSTDRDRARLPCADKLLCLLVLLLPPFLLFTLFRSRIRLKPGSVSGVPGAV